LEATGRNCKTFWIDPTIYDYKLYKNFLGLDNIVGNYKGIDLIDHINHDKLNNCVENLRITNGNGNQQNRKNTKGYTFNKQLNKYFVSTYLTRKYRYEWRFLILSAFSK